MSPHGGKQEFKRHIKTSDDQEAEESPTRNWDASTVERLNGARLRLHDESSLLDLAEPFVAYLRVPFVIGRVSTSLNDNTIRSARDVITRKVLNGLTVEEKLKHELKEVAQQEQFVQLVDAVEGDCDWHAFILTPEQKEWLDTDPRLGRNVQADYTFHVFGKRQPIFLGALIAVHPISARSLPIAFFLYKDTGAGIRRRTLEWALRELNSVMRNHAEPSRSIEHIVVDWEGAHIAAGLDFVMKEMEDALGFLDGELARVCSDDPEGN